MCALVLVLVIGKKAGLVGVNCAGAVFGVIFKTESGISGDDIGAFRLFVSGVVKGVVVTGEDAVLEDP